MKALLTKIFFLVFLLITLDSKAQDFKDELNRAKKENKPAILYFYSRFCPYCALMERDVILDSTVKKILDKEVVFIWIDGEAREDLRKRYSVWGFPTFVLLEPSGKFIASLPGYIPKRQFLRILDYLKGGHYKRIPLRNYLREKEG